MSAELAGMCVPLCTPMSDDGSEIDEGALVRHIDAMVEADLDMILVCGGTGEFPFLTAEEKTRIARVAARHLDGRKQLVVQTSAIRTEDAVAASKEAEALGADAVLVLPPYFEGPGPEGVLYHYARVAESVGIPVMAYNIPAFSDFDITPEFFERLREHTGIEHIKDSTGDLVRIQQLIARGVKVFNGADPLVFAALTAGSTGCIVGGMNALPREMARVHGLVERGAYDEAMELWGRILPACIHFWTHEYNATVKAATNRMGYSVGPCRKPIQPLTQEQLAEVEHVLPVA
ncbi:MAG: dihydrodipicolinate synthase family protein [Halofilum sp. (in: g-proteobacteria)]|nr:dihydrodipicolinate synthase family protein [Halofilum sp. (in: g-proteobacteria)]